MEVLVLPSVAVEFWLVRLPSVTVFWVEVVDAEGDWDEAGGGEACDWVDVVGFDVCGVGADCSVCCAEGLVVGTSLELLCAKAAVEIRMAAVVVINCRLIMVSSNKKRTSTTRKSDRSKIREKVAIFMSVLGGTDDAEPSTPH